MRTKRYLTMKQKKTQKIQQSLSCIKYHEDVQCFESEVKIRRIKNDQNTKKKQLMMEESRPSGRKIISFLLSWSKIPEPTWLAPRQALVFLRDTPRGQRKMLGTFLQLLFDSRASIASSSWRWVEFGHFFCVEDFFILEQRFLVFVGITVFFSCVVWCEREAWL